MTKDQLQLLSVAVLRDMAKKSGVKSVSALRTRRTIVKTVPAMAQSHPGYPRRIMRDGRSTEDRIRTVMRAGCMLRERAVSQRRRMEQALPAEKNCRMLPETGRSRQPV